MSRRSYGKQHFLATDTHTHMHTMKKCLHSFCLTNRKRRKRKKNNSEITEQHIVSMYVREFLYVFCLLKRIYNFFFTIDIHCICVCKWNFHKRKARKPFYSFISSHLISVHFRRRRRRFFYFHLHSHKITKIQDSFSRSKKNIPSSKT